MNYTYNIKVNLKKHLINFYEWSSVDKIIVLNRVPYFVVSDKDYINIFNMSIKIDNFFLEKIKMFKNICLFTNLIDVICIQFDKKGHCYKISKLILNEETDVINEIKNRKVVKINYKLTNGSNNYKYNTRAEEKIILKILDYIKMKKEEEKLIDYLYYERFDTRNSNNKYDDLIKGVSSPYSNKHEQLYKIIKLIEYKNA